MSTKYPLKRSIYLQTAWEHYWQVTSRTTTFSEIYWSLEINKLTVWQFLLLNSRGTKLLHESVWLRFNVKFMQRTTSGLRASTLNIVSAVSVSFYIIAKASEVSAHLNAQTSSFGLLRTSARSRSWQIWFPLSIRDLQQLSLGIKIILCDLCRLSLADFERKAKFSCDPRRRVSLKIVLTDDSYS